MQVLSASIESSMLAIKHASVSLSLQEKRSTSQKGNLKNSEQGGSVYFFGSEIWLKFTFFGEKN